MSDIRYPLSLRQVEDISHRSRIESYRETVRFLWDRSGPVFAKQIHRRPANMHSNRRRHLDDVFVRAKDDQGDLWPAIDLEEVVLESYAPKHQDRRITLNLKRKFISRHGPLHKIVTGKQGSYSSAPRALSLKNRHETGR